ncbi:MAG: NADP-dependent phosphogluconate dehydrogenase [Myxococcota bacterium]
MSAPACTIAMVGLGVMGGSLARNLARHGQRVALFDRDPAAGPRLAAGHPEAGFVPCDSVAALVAAVARPRAIVLLVPAGAPVDEALAALSPLLEAGDVVVDAGNSFFLDTDRRAEAARSAPWHFVGMGVSGGSEGALLGPSLMPGGDPAAWSRLRPVLESIAAVSDSGPCVADCGRGSAGHFVKMVHNGIEYGDMQLIAETASLLREGLGLSPARCADTFAAWNEAELESYLVEITATILRTADPERPGAPLLDAILDRAEQKGTGRWTIGAALELGVPIPTITAAVDARLLSADRARRLEASARFAGGEAKTRALPRLAADVGVDDLRGALYAAKIASYSQGFDLLARASAAYAYGTDLASVARIWTAGCIIRAGLLGRVRTAFTASAAGSAAAPPLLVLTPEFAAEIRTRLPGWRRTVAAAASAGIAVPGLSASLAWFDGLVTARGSASLIQAQRDYFGHHGYERADAPGRAVHTDWPNARRLD